MLSTPLCPKPCQQMNFLDIFYCYLAFLILWRIHCSICQPAKLHMKYANSIFRGDNPSWLFAVSLDCNPSSIQYSSVWHPFLQWHPIMEARNHRWWLGTFNAFSPQKTLKWLILVVLVPVQEKLPQSLDLRWLEVMLYFIFLNFASSYSPS